MAWIYLIFAGLLETGWAFGLKRTGESPHWLLTLLTGIMLVASMAGLMLAMKRIPISIAYPVWTGIGAVGSVIIGAVVFKEPVSPSTVLGVLLLCAGMALVSARAH